MRRAVVWLAAAALAAADEPPPATVAVDAASGGTEPAPPCNPRRHVRKSLSPAYVVAHADDGPCVATRRSVHGATLGYVTPWARAGFDLAANYSALFTHVSPVWFQLRDGEPASAGPRLTGGHDVDTAWLAALRARCDAGGPCPLVVPRVSWEARGRLAPRAVADLVRDAVVAHDFDGIVWEAPAAAAVFSDFVPSVVSALRAAPGRRRTVIVVLPPAGVPPATVASLVAAGVDFFSVMTYDRSAHAGKSGPNSPLPWARAALEALVDPGAPPAAAADVRRRLLLGTPFYGYNGAEPIVGHAVLGLLRAHAADARVKRDGAAEEHYIVFDSDDAAAAGGRGTVWYPTPWSLALRVQLANEFGGLAIWELGQGQRWFFDAL